MAASKTLAIPEAVTLLGCGNMGGALLRIWSRVFPDIHFIVIDPAPLPAEFQNNKNIVHAPSPTEAADQIRESKIIVLAVKPQIMKEACAGLKPFIKPEACILSIAAGKSLATLQSLFSENQPVVRAMPNTPAAIGKGITVAISNPQVHEMQKQHVTTLLESAGKFIWAGDESVLDAVTALSASGAGYVFYLIEILTKAGQAIGLTPDMAEKLARQTMIGSAALAEASPDVSAATLRENVTSPGGTTAAALKVFMDSEIQDIFDRALTAACDRSRELNKQS